MRRLPVYVLLAVVVVLWGGAFVAIRILVRDLSALTVTLLRFALTSGALLAVNAAAGERPRIQRPDRGKVLVLAVTGVSAYHLSLNYGEHFVSAGVASLIIASMPVMVAILSALFLRDQINGLRWAGIALALAGVALLVVRGTPGVALKVESLLGALVIAVAPLSWAIYTVVAKPLAARYGALPLTTVSMVLGTLLLVPFAAPATLVDLGDISLAQLGWLLFLSLGCTVFAYLVWFKALQVLPASSVAVWVYFVPVSALAWAGIVLGERLTPFVALGGAMVLAGVILTERVPRTAGRERAEAEVAGDGAVSPRTGQPRPGAAVRPATPGRS